VRSKGLIVVAVPLVALMGTTAATLALQHTERQDRSVSEATLTLDTAADQVLADAVNAETGLRGYAATGDALFLDPYTLTLSRIGADRRSLRDAAIAEGDSRPGQAIGATTGTVLGELADLRVTIGTGVSPGSLRPALENEKTTMDRLRRQVATLTAGPAAVQKSERGRVTSLETTIDRLNLAALVLGMLAGLAGIALFTSGISRRVTAAAANANRLGEGKPLTLAGPCGDELGHLADSLVRAEQLLASRAADLTAARDEALHATRAKNTFLSRTSHELRTPLNSVLGFTQLLEMSDLSEEDHDSAGRILTAGRHLLALINELIDIARIESGDISLSLEPVSLVPLIEEVSQLMGPLAAERSIEIICRCAPPDLAAHADRQRCAQILVNLVSNAVKYNRRGGTITITGQEAGAGQASMVVTDTGPGLPAGDITRIFAPFERLEAGQAGIEGTGIGLPLARALTEAMGGQLTASSIPGAGSAFTVTLPRGPDTTGVPPDDALPASLARRRTPPGSTLHILYIEDNPANVEVIARFLKNRPGTELHSVATGRDGIDYATGQVPGIILLDVHLPDMHGSDVLAELKADPITTDIPVVVLSAEASPGIIRRLITNGALAYLTKPINLADLGTLLDSFAAPAYSPHGHPAAPR
jgi:signal transduction histidine kinase/ActR/RegA family two-component response regulator